MKRGDLYRVRHPSGDVRRSRVFVVVSRQTLIDSRFSTVVCAPVYSRRDGLATQVAVGVEEGLKHASSIHCDALVSLSKSTLTDYLAALGSESLVALDRALRIALALE
ncbi:MAG TPA: type II toxin-antitoxin system PemK/MazF family toxin [Thermoanaerobaculia bacterium]|nr:type II toxin-antitoxin system PemK/MazF family toxin [Thermoanaerobaculia bacterium]